MICGHEPTADASGLPESSVEPGDGGAATIDHPGTIRNRARIMPDERRELDARMIERLTSMGLDPIRRNNRVLVDVEVDPGMTFTDSSKREKWAFASVAAERAAENAIVFDLFAQSADFADLRHFVLRPRGKKATIEGLLASIQELSAAYNQHVGRLISDGKIRPLLSVIHVRYDERLQMFDLHLHCLWLITQDDLDTVWKGIQTKFSTVWMEPEKIHNPAALANYVLTWIVDHREAQDWPDEAVKALWSLPRPRLIRPAGAFAEFKATLEGQRPVREDGAIQIVPIQRRPPPARSPLSKPPSVTGTVVGYVQAKLLGELRWCAIAFVQPGERLTRQHKDEILAGSRRAQRTARSDDPDGYDDHATKPTTTTGLSPFSAASSSDPADPSPDEAQRPATTPTDTNPAAVVVLPPVFSPTAQGTLQPDHTTRAGRWQAMSTFLRVGIRGLLQGLAWLTPRGRRRMRKSRDSDNGNHCASGPAGIAPEPPT
jgi:hypothetical protein